MSLKSYMLYKDTREKVENAIKKLFEYDSFLLENDLNERTINHKLAKYLSECFDEYYVDCEYNRIYNTCKKVLLDYKCEMGDEIKIEEVTSDDSEAKTIYPDIIIHIRNCQKFNLLAIEIKKNANKRKKQDDLNKLKSIVNQLHYQYGLFINFRTGRGDISIEEPIWLKRGKGGRVYMLDRKGNKKRTGVIN